MKRAFVRIPCLFAISIALAVIPEPIFAQHGGHGGGGFHGGGFGHGGFRGHSGFHGGGFSGHGVSWGAFRGNGGFSGFRSGGFRGFSNGRGFGGFPGRNGFKGFGPGFAGAFRGFRPYGYGYGLSFDLGFFPFWGYPFFAGYSSPWWVAPYPYYYPPYDYPDGDAGRGYSYPRHDHCRRDYRYDNRCGDASPGDSRSGGDIPPAQPSNNALPESSHDRSYVASNSEDYITSPAQTSVVAGRLALASARASKIHPGVRPAVRNAIEALRAMPPDARERQISSARYADFSAAERQLLENTRTHVALIKQ
ncbi:MAG: hypothetical protein JO159_18240 [Acidobacteria bacterium]|nr:hypothetical protein [Acidobacteriota bacterium]